MPSNPLGTIWVCTDCLMTEQSGELPHYETDREPWSKIDHPSQTTIGMGADEHEDDCPAFDHAHQFTGRECMGCETQDFSWSRCDGCGSTLGGERHAYTLWED